MKSLLWLLRALALPVVSIALLWWWSVGAIARTGQEGMAWWACVLLFGGLALCALAPRVAVVALYGAFVLQLVRVDTRFDQAGWLPYAAVALVAIVLAARTGEQQRRARLAALLALGVVIGLFTNLPILGPIVWSDDGHGGSESMVGLVNGKSWAPLTTFSGWELLIGTVVWTVGAVLLVVAGWMIGSTYRARRLQWTAQAEAEAARLALSSSEQRLQVTEERDRIAQDVHDITAHSLSVILAQADGAAAHAEEPNVQSALTTIAGSARQALTELRGLLEHLEQRSDGDTAHSAVEVVELVETVRAAGADVEYTSCGTVVPLSQGAGLAVYRIVQEALTNALRHGDRTEPIRVLLDWKPDGVAVTITSPIDLTSASAASSSGRGVIGMQQRARMAGGWLTSGVDVDTASYLVTGHLPSQRTVIA